ncbi:unnamed protein product [Pleuronectes platessa]|uniref:Uncharacterized protein n=1 Tax=Pleuronectes platessa TaxID=8262 RepID=A0A9N7Z6W3_PLEPL|nr:unnamed protein product [Pleuronectes platessa]
MFPASAFSRQHCVEWPGGFHHAVAPQTRAAQQPDVCHSVKGRTCGQFPVMRNHHQFKIPAEWTEDMPSFLSPVIHQ